MTNKSEQSWLAMETESGRLSALSQRTVQVITTDCAGPVHPLPPKKSPHCFVFAHGLSW